MTGRPSAFRAALAALAAGTLLLGPLPANPGPAAAHSPDPLIGWPAWNQDQDVRYRWRAGEVPPAKMQTPIKAGAADANRTKGSRAPTLTYDASGASAVEYGLNVFCGINGLACADGRNAPTSFRIGFREHGHRFDWGTLRWCQMLAEIANGCFDVENIMLDEVGHVLGLGHHENFPDERDYGDSVVQTVSRARPKSFWNAHDFGRCDVARLQTRYDMTGSAALYSTCLDLNVILAFRASTTAVAVGAGVTFTATLTVADNPGDGRLTGNPVAKRLVQLQSRPVGGTSWSTVAQMPAGSPGGTYALSVTPGSTRDWRAVFPKPSNEGLRAATSPAIRVSVHSCSTSPCPASVQVGVAEAGTR